MQNRGFVCFACFAWVGICCLVLEGVLINSILFYYDFRYLAEWGLSGDYSLESKKRNSDKGHLQNIQNIRNPSLPLRDITQLAKCKVVNRRPPSRIYADTVSGAVRLLG
jgi:hypothetical protein